MTRLRLKKTIKWFIILLRINKVQILWESHKVWKNIYLKLHSNFKIKRDLFFILLFAFSEWYLKNINSHYFFDYGCAEWYIYIIFPISLIFFYIFLDLAIFYIRHRLLYNRNCTKLERVTLGAITTLVSFRAEAHCRWRKKIGIRYVD